MCVRKNIKKKKIATGQARLLLITLTYMIPL